MKKIISLFQRNYEGDHFVRDEIVPGAEWVIAGEGVGTRKFDGTCCMVRAGKLYKRYDAKNGKTPPPNFEPAQDPDPVTGHWPGWLPVGDGPEDKYHREALAEYGADDLYDGTYELIGPKVQSNAEHINEHILVRHGGEVIPENPRTFDAIREFLFRYRDSEGFTIEGIVWHHPDGRMVKIKRKDFNYAVK